MELPSTRVSHILEKPKDSACPANEPAWGAGRLWDIPVRKRTQTSITIQPTAVIQSTGAPQRPCSQRESPARSGGTRRRVLRPTALRSSTEEAGATLDFRETIGSSCGLRIFSYLSGFVVAEATVNPANPPANSLWQHGSGRLCLGPSTPRQRFLSGKDKFARRSGRDDRRKWPRNR
jgi:hypothetical protein